MTHLCWVEHETQTQNPTLKDKVSYETKDETTDGYVKFVHHVMYRVVKVSK